MVVNCVSGTVMIHGAQTEYIFRNIIDCKFMTFELDINGLSERFGLAAVPKVSTGWDSTHSFTMQRF